MDRSNATTQRLLRVDIADADGQERGFTPTKLEKLTSPSVEQKVQGWLRSGEPAKAAFSRLQLAQAGDKLFDNPNFVAWVKYVDDLSAKHPGQAESAIPTLTARFGDAALFELLLAAKKISSTQSLATKLQAEQIQHWSLKGKSPDSVLKLFSLEKTADGFLTNAQFGAWVKYADDFNMRYPEKPVSMVSALRAQFGDEAFFQMLEAAKKLPATKRSAIKLEAEQIHTWLTMKEIPNKVFHALGLQKVGDDLLSSPVFNTWLNYRKDFNRKNPKAKSTLYDTLTPYYKTDLMVTGAMKNPSTKKIAERVQSEMRPELLLRKVSPESVFYTQVVRQRDTTRVLQADNFLLDPNFKTWAKYLSDFNKNYPDMKTDMIKSFRSYYRDDVLSQALSIARKDPSTEKMATNLQTSLLNSWAREKKSPGEVAKLLKVKTSDALMQTYTKKYDWALRNVKDEVVDDLKMETVLKYVADFNAKNPGNGMSDIGILTARYGDEPVAKMIAESMKNQRRDPDANRLFHAQRHGWLSSGKSADDVFRLLKLDQAGTGLLDSPVMSTWKYYVGPFSRKYPRTKTTELEVLRRSYPDEALSKILIWAKGDYRTKGSAQSWQTNLLSSWLEEKKSPKDVFKWLQVKGSAPESAEKQLYLSYWLDYKVKYSRARVQ